MINLHDTYPLKLCTLSPVAIGNGLPDSSFSIYHYDGEHFYYLDFSKLKELSYTQEQLERLLEGIEKGMNNNKIDDFGGLFQSIFNEPLAVLATQEVKTKGLKEGEVRIIKEILKTNNKPYLSGSTLKGAIKGALLSHFIKEKQGRINVVHFKDGQEIKQTINLIDNILEGKKIDKEIQDFENTLFGRTNQSKYIHWANTFRMTDSTTISTWEVLAGKRLHLGDKEANIPYLQEVIPVNETFEVQLQIDKMAKIDPEVNFYDMGTRTGIKKIFDVLRQESLYFIKYEIERLDATLAHYAFYTKLKETIENDPDKAYLRIGGGKTFFQNSVALAIKHIDEKAFLEMIAMYKPKKADEVAAKDFPITRAEVAETETPLLGWVSIEIDEHNIRFSDNLRLNSIRNFLTNS